MLWAVWCEDEKNSGDVRHENGPAHSRHLDNATIPLVIAGPLTTDNGERSTGSLLIFEAADRAAVQTQMDTDPFVLSGVWNKVHISAFRLSRETLSPKE
jgi:uncharacterized protein YciI